MKRSALVLLLALAGLTCWAFLRGGEGLPSAPAPSVRPDRDTGALPLGGDEDLAQAPARRGIELEQPEAEAAASPTLPPELSEDVQLEGLAIRLDGDEQYVSDDGRLVLTWRRGATRETREVSVSAGRWSVQVPPDVNLLVKELILAGMPLSLEQREVVVPADLFLELRGVGRRSVLLHVLSAADRRELDQVEVWKGPYSFPTDLAHPGGEPEGEAVLRGAASPVRIPAQAASFNASFQYFVRAPGHAWGSIAIDHSEGGQRELLLQPTCELEVELIGNADWLEPKVRLWPPDTSRWAAYPYAWRHPDDDDRALFEGVAPGTYFVSVERGWADRRVSYGSAEVTLTAGERADVPIRVTLPERPVSVPVSGTLTVPLAWEQEGMQLNFGGEGPTEAWLPGELSLALEEMSAATSAPQGCRRFAWKVELPMAGDYELEVYPLLVRQLLQVPDGGLSDVAVVVPAPAEVQVRVVDAAAGEEVPVESLHWSTLAIEGIVATPLYTAVVDHETGRVGFRAPAGPINLSTIDRSLLPVDGGQLYELQPGANLLELRVHRQLGVHFTFMDGDAVVPWSWNWRLSAHRVDGQGRDRTRGIGMLWFLEEGLYELRSAGIPGYESIDGIQIQVRAGEGVMEQVIQLVRE